MKLQHVDYETVPYPKVRRFLEAAFRTTHHKPMIHGLVEVDVSGPRAALRDYKARTGEALSLTAFLITCLAKAVDEDKSVQAFRQGGDRLVVFEDVDVLTYVEREVGGRKQIMPCIIRAANRKVFLDIHREIRTAQVQDVAGAMAGLSRFMSLPAFLYGPLFWAFARLGRRNPRLWKDNWGTVALSAVGMFGQGAGWGLPPATPSLWVTVGGIGEQPRVVNGQIQVRDALSLTVSVDHNITDGAMAARFTERLKELIEGGYGLDDLGDVAAPVEPAGAEDASTRQVSPVG
jgi:pyruvate/2-oxoglutarate dehydrogenase complex dihydrolipoamide acyltransferase (E2) component